MKKDNYHSCPLNFGLFPLRPFNFKNSHLSILNFGFFSLCPPLFYFPSKANGKMWFYPHRNTHIRAHGVFLFAFNGNETKWQSGSNPKFRVLRWVFKVEGAREATQGTDGNYPWKRNDKNMAIQLPIIHFSGPESFHQLQYDCLRK